MATLNALKNRIRTLGLTSEDDEVKGDSPMAASARAKGLDKYDMATGIYSGPGAAISNAIRAARGDLNTEAMARKDMGSKAAREADAEVKRETRGIEKTGTDRARESAKQIADEEKYTKKTKDQSYAKGGKVSASSRADGCATKGKTRGKFV